MKNIAIITGGDSAEYDISILSANTVYQNLDKKKYKPFIVEIKKGVWQIRVNGEQHQIKDNLKIKLNEKELLFKDVFMALHGPPAENGDLQILFEKNQINFTCCDSKVSKLTFNKFECNNTLRKLNYDIAKSLLITNEKYNKEDICNKIKLPFIVKPNQAGSSNGISLVKLNSEIDNAILNALKHDNEVIIEEYIDGIEVSCGVFNIKNKVILLPITEIISENEFFDYEAKYFNKSQEITPARISEKHKNIVHSQSKKIFEDLNLRGLCRIDFIIKNDKAFVIEINTIPGLSEKSIIPQQLKKAGYSLKEVFTICLEN